MRDEDRLEILFWWEGEDLAHERESDEPPDEPARGRRKPRRGWSTRPAPRRPAS